MPSPSKQPRPAPRRDWRPIAGCAVGAVVSSLSWLRWHSNTSAVLVWIACSLLLLALLLPRLFAPIQRVVDFLIHLLLQALSWALLLLVFLLCVLPGRLLLLLLRRDPLRRAAAPAWNPLAPDRDPARFTRQF